MPKKNTALTSCLCALCLVIICGQSLESSAAQSKPTQIQLPLVASHLPPSMHLTARYDPNPLGNPRAIYLHPLYPQDFVYVQYDYGVEILWHSLDDTFNKVGEISTNSYFHDPIFANDRMYINTSVYDIATQPAQPRLLATLTFSQPFSLSAGFPITYSYQPVTLTAPLSQTMSMQGYPLGIIDWSIPETPTTQSVIYTAGTVQIAQADTSGQYLALMTSYGLEIFDVTSHADPKLILRREADKNVSYGRKLMDASYKTFYEIENGKLFIVDLHGSTPQVIPILSGYSFGGARCLANIENKLFMQNALTVYCPKGACLLGNSLTAIDISNPLQAIKISVPDQATNEYYERYKKLKGSKKSYLAGQNTFDPYLGGWRLFDSDTVQPVADYPFAVDVILHNDKIYILSKTGTIYRQDSFTQKPTRVYVPNKFVGVDDFAITDGQLILQTSGSLQKHTLRSDGTFAFANELNGITTPNMGMFEQIQAKTINSVPYIVATDSSGIYMIDTRGSMTTTSIITHTQVPNDFTQLLVSDIRTYAKYDTRARFAYSPHTYQIGTINIGNPLQPTWVITDAIDRSVEGNFSSGYSQSIWKDAIVSSNLIYHITSTTDYVAGVTQFSTYFNISEVLPTTTTLKTHSAIKIPNTFAQVSMAQNQNLVYLNSWIATNVTTQTKNITQTLSVIDIANPDRVTLLNRSNHLFYGQDIPYGGFGYYGHTPNARPIIYNGYMYVVVDFTTIAVYDIRDPMHITQIKQLRLFEDLGDRIAHWEIYNNHLFITNGHSLLVYEL